MKQRKGCRMSCDVCKATEGLDNELWRTGRSSDGKCKTSFSKLSVASPTSQLILQPFRPFTYVTAHSPNLSLLRHRLFTYVTWRAAHGRMRGPAMSNWGRFLCIFLRNFYSRCSRKFFTCCTTIFFKSICHKLHISLICWCYRPSWFLGHCLCSHRVAIFWRAKKTHLPTYIFKRIAVMIIFNASTICRL